MPACVVMPRTAPAVKRAATEGYGARVVPCEPTLADREATVGRLIAEHGYVLVHPFDDWRVIAGQGTAALELIEQAGPLDVVIAPVGGGGLLAGTALAARGRRPATRVDRRRAGGGRRRQAIARIRRDRPLGRPEDRGRRPADFARRADFRRPPRHVDGIVTANEAEILDAMRFVWERLKIVVEPSAPCPWPPC